MAGYTFRQKISEIAVFCIKEHQVRNEATCRITAGAEIRPGLYTNSVMFDTNITWKQDNTEIKLSGIYTFLPKDIFEEHSSEEAVFYAFEFIIGCENVRTARKWYEKKYGKLKKKRIKGGIIYYREWKEKGIQLEIIKEKKKTIIGKVCVARVRVRDFHIEQALIRQAEKLNTPEKK